MSEEVDVSEWPDLLRKLARLIGPALTRELAAKWGGLDDIYIPTRPTAAHRWCDVLDAESWAKVVSAFGGQWLDLPKGSRLGAPKKVMILELAAKGMSTREIALKVGCIERYVRRVTADVEGIARSDQRVVVDERQMQLFGGQKK